MSRTSIEQLLNLPSPPGAVPSAPAAPAGVPHVAAVEPAGCGYWRRAAAGEVFYTVADDHKRCPIGAHTHNVTLSPEEKQELMGLVQTMVGLSYLKMEEVPQIPTRKTPLEVAVYAPVDRAPVAPCVVLVRGHARARGDHAYYAMPGAQLAVVEEHLAVIVHANQELEKFHRGRLQP